jgi:hypothetical protein
MRSEDRSSMSMFARSGNHGRAFIGAWVCAAFVWALALSDSPQLHQRVHADAKRVEHTCAVTLITSGSYEHAAHPPLVSAPQPILEFSKTAVLNPVWVQPLILKAHVFAHAPPASG